LADEHANLVELFTQASTMPGDTPRLAARLAWASVAVLHRHGYRHEAFTVIDGAVSVTTRLGMTLELGAALFYRAQLTKGAGNADAVEADLARCLELTRSLGNQARISACLDSLGNLRYRQGEPVEALVFHEEALAVRRALGLPLPIGASLSNMAQVRFDNGQVAEAFEGVDEALKLAREIGATGLEGAALSMRGRLLCRTGHWADSLSSLTEAIVCTEATNDLHTRCEAHLTRVATHLGRADHEAALRDATRAEDLAMRVGDHYLRAVARWAASRVAAAAGDEVSAQQLAEQAREFGRPVSAYREPMYEHFFGSLPTAT
jgi:tetratricopeptide (TPR) repeat protein